MNEIDRNDLKTALARRAFLKASGGFGALALAELIGGHRLMGQTPNGVTFKSFGIIKEPHVPPRAKRVIRIHMTGAVSQLDTFDYKPMLEKWNGTDLPASIRNGQRLTSMTSTQSSFPVAPSAATSA